MRGREDHFDTLRKANPVPPGQLPARPTPEGARAFLQEVMAMDVQEQQERRAQQRESPRRQRSRRPLIAVTAVVAAGLALGMAYLTRDVSEQTGIGCYAAADLQADTAVIGASGGDPETGCADLWERGEFGPGPVPELSACVLASGAVGVFPGDGGTCGKLGLAPIPDNYQSDVSAVVPLRDALVDKFLAAECLSLDDARAIVSEELVDQGLVDWTIEAAAPFTSTRPCAGLAFETDNKVVSLVPGPPV